MKTIKVILITFLLSISFIFVKSQCNYSIVLLDTFGDGWNGGEVIVTVGSTVNGPYTIASGAGPLTYSFPVTIGNSISVTYTAGQWPEENEYFIYNNQGIEIFHDGPNPTANNTNIGIASCPSCNTPTGLTATAITLNSATIGWTTPGTLSNIQYGIAGFTLGTGTIVNGLTTNTYNLSGLTSATSYSFYVQNDCGGGDLSSWTGPYTFSTLVCLPANQCTFAMNMHDIGNSWNGAGITVYQNGVNMGFFTVTGGGQNLANVNLCNGANIQLSWTTGVYDNETSFEMLDPSNNIVFSWATGNAPTAGLFYTFTSSCIPVTCPKPITLTATNISDVSATLNWVPQGSATTWEIEYGPVGFAIGTGTLINNITSHPYILNGLNSNTNYSFYVRSDCGGGDYSVWSGPITFTTLLSILNNPSVCGLQIHIPDAGCVDIPINVSGVSGTQMGTTVNLKDVNFIITHTWDADINAILESPSGATVSLVSNTGGGGDNFGIVNGLCDSYTNFNMTGINGPIGTGIPPFVGSYIPLGNFNSLNDNSNPNGTWILHVCDAMNADTGSVQFVQLVFDPIIPPATVLINELDCDQTGNDSLEFVELYDGGVGNYPLDGYTVVFYNGSTDQSYLSFDLDGYTTDNNGYFVIGNSTVSGSSITFADNLLQNGADAVALYTDNASTFPAGTTLTLTNLVDAIVYETSDPTDVQLLTLLNSGQPQIDENLYNNKDIVSCSRISNGTGGLRNTATYKAAVPTPKAANQALPELIWLTSVFNEAFTNNGSITNSLNLKLKNHIFSNIGTFTEGVEYTTANVPAGLTTVINILTDTTATISLIGNASQHLNINDINNLTITFLNAAYFGLSSNFVIGNSKNNIGIDFIDTTPPTMIWDNSIFNESITNNGSTTDSIIVKLYTETFILNSGIFLPSTHYTTSNIPAGITVQIESTTDTSAIIRLYGNALNHTSADNINNMSIIFNDAAFTGGIAANVANYHNDTLEINFLDPFYQDLTPTIIPSDTLYICNSCPTCAPDVYIHNNGPTALLQNDSIIVYYQYPPLSIPIIDTIILANNLLPNDSILYEPVLNITQNGIYGFEFYIYSNSDNNNLNDTAYITINSYQVSVDLGGINDTILVTSYPHFLNAGIGVFPFTYLWSDNSTSQTISVSSDGWYFVTVTDFNGCTASDSVYIYQNIDILDLAVSINPSDTIFICNNCPCNYPDFLIINNGPNPVYQSDTIIINYIYSPLTAPVTDTLIINSDFNMGDTLIYNPSMNITEIGLYPVQVFISNSNDFETNNDTAFSNIYAYQISTNLGGINDTITVNGFPYMLDAGSCTSPFGCNYLWSDLEITQTINVNSEGWYIVNVSDSYGCSAIDSVYVLLNPNLTDLSFEYNTSETIYICNSCSCNFPHFLIINNGPNTLFQNDSIQIFSIYPPLTIPTIETYVLTTDLLPTDTIIYTPTINGQLGSYPYKSFIYNFNNTNNLNDTLLTNIYSYNLTVDLGGVNDTIIVSTEWPSALFAGNCNSPFNCNYLWSTGSTSNVIGIIANGWYSLTTTDDFGCNAVDSVYMYKPDGINEISDINEIKVYPNPAKDNVNIEINLKNKTDITFCLYSISGQVIKEKMIQGQNFIKESFDISEVSSGIYYLKIATDENVRFVKLVVQ
ncbi:MAG: fibronectin type III domain-containing protein [Bacteroidia bacterium]|nr:fibronectin type III domain-containing protein [Bacteroidia bacterium]